MTSRHLLALCAVLATGAIGIATQSSRTTAAGATRPSTEPTPEGIELSSYGIGVLSADDEAPLGVLHVRVAITNRSPRGTWVVDVSRARLQTPTLTLAPLFARAAATTLPLIIAGAGERQVVELYFPAPPADEAFSKALALTWLMNSPSGTLIAGTIARESLVDGRPSAAHAWAGSNATRLVWWADPTHPWPTFWHRSGPISSRPPEAIVIVSEPSWDLAWLSASASRLEAGDEAPVSHECDEW